MSETISEIDRKLNAILGIDYEEHQESEESKEITIIPEQEIELIDSKSNNDLVVVEEKDQSDIDFDFARQNIKELSDIGMENIKKLSSIAKDSQTPRMFEVLSGMIKNIGELNTGLIDIHNKKLSSTTATEEAPSSTINVNQAVICTSTDTLRKIKERKKK